MLALGITGPLATSAIHLAATPVTVPSTMPPCAQSPQIAQIDLSSVQTDLSTVQHPLSTAQIDLRKP
jgi:hypothetical protein